MLPGTAGGAIVAFMAGLKLWVATGVLLAASGGKVDWAGGGTGALTFGRAATGVGIDAAAKARGAVVSLP
jgi:hypothetical protein